MKLIKVSSQEELGASAAEIFAGAIKSKPDLVIGLATGSSPLPLYEELARMNKAGAVDFAKVRSVNLDEYAGLAPDHDQSYRYFMDKNLFDHINIDKANTHVPDGLAKDPVSECARYDALIDGLGGIGLQLLGIGPNGHVGFNEPSDVFSNHTQYEKLTDSTIAANARFFETLDDVPKYAFTMGIRHIMLAKKIVLVAGPEKKDILEKAMNGSITPQVPASVLQLHPDTTIIAIS